MSKVLLFGASSIASGNILSVNYYIILPFCYCILHIVLPSGYCDSMIYYCEFKVLYFHISKSLDDDLVKRANFIISHGQYNFYGIEHGYGDERCYVK